MKQTKSNEANYFSPNLPGLYVCQTLIKPISYFFSVDDNTNSSPRFPTSSMNIMNAVLFYVISLFTYKPQNYQPHNVRTPHVIKKCLSKAGCLLVHTFGISMCPLINQLLFSIALSKHSCTSNSDLKNNCESGYVIRFSCVIPIPGKTFQTSYILVTNKKVKQ